jgi:antirestriction protein ArdC
MNNQVYEKITDIIIAKLEQGVVPWHKPWNSYGSPVNLVSKRAYRGINVFLLMALDYEFPYYLSFKQAKQLGGTIKRGEKAHVVVFYKWMEATDESGNVIIKDDGQPKIIPMLRYYNIFNIEQCAYLDPKYIPEFEQHDFQPIEKAESIVQTMPHKPEIQFSKGSACYIPNKDLVMMPSQQAFKSNEELYSTLFHELTHSTGHVSRLSRPGVADIAAFGSNKYSKEELIAEMGATFLCAEVGIANQTINNSAAYINSWLNKLRNDKRLVLIAAGAAQKACDYILNSKFNNGDDNAN